MNFLNCRNFLKARGFLTCWHLFTFFTVAPFLSTTLVILDFCFILVASNTGSRRCYFPCCSILQGNFPNFGMEILALRSGKSFRGLYFPNFVLMQYIVVQKLVKANPRCLNTFCLFLLFACNCSNLSKQEVKHSYYNLSIKGEKYQLDLSKF